MALDDIVEVWTVAVLVLLAGSTAESALGGFKDTFVPSGCDFSPVDRSTSADAASTLEPSADI